MSESFYNLLEKINTSGQLPPEMDMVNKFNSFLIMSPEAVISKYKKHPVYKSSISTVRAFVEDMTVDELKKVLINELDIHYPGLMKLINEDGNQTAAFIGILNAAIVELKPTGDENSQ